MPLMSHARMEGFNFKDALTQPLPQFFFFLHVGWINVARGELGDDETRRWWARGYESQLCSLIPGLFSLGFTGQAI